MPQPNQEQTARRFQAFDTENTPSRSQADYECELPPEVRTELNRPKRPRILGRSKAATLKAGVKWPLYLAAVIAVLIIGTTVWRQRDTAERAKTNKAISQPLAPQPASVPASTSGPTVSGREYLANNPPVPRAVLVKSAPRAQLVKLPPSRTREVGESPPLVIGQHYLATMPYNVEVLATYRGQMDSVDLLPSHGNQIGDMRRVGNVPWVWVFAPGAAHADWIDP